MKYLISAESVGYLSKEIEAKSEDEAYQILEDLLENGELPEVDGSIENEKVELI